jgi:hypothetical protein
MLPAGLVADDTSPDAAEAQFEAYRRMGGAGRAAVMFRLSEATRRWALAGIRARHPEYDQRQAFMAYARLTLGEELTRRVWPELDPVEP